MEEKEFRSQLMESMKLARKQGMCLSEEQIHSFFPDIQQGSEQMGFLLEYYKNQKIGVGDRKEVEEYLSMEDRNYLEEYLNGISALESMETEELKAVMLSAIAGDQDAKEVLLQQFLPKTAELAKLYAINPSTAAKGVNILVDAGILYKKRGIGMFVSDGAKEVIRTKRKARFC